jgi:predicted nucleotidyltransferase
MGTAISDKIARGLFGQTRRSVLALLFGRPKDSFYLREIVRATGAGTGPVQRELARLVDAGLIRRNPRGNQVYFSADPASPVFDELCGLVAKTAGVADVVRLALADLGRLGKIAVAFVYGSVASGRQKADSDVDLFVLGSVKLSELLPVLRPVQEQLGREINPTIYRPEEFATKVMKREHFVSRVLQGPKIMLVGSPNDLEALAGESLVDRARVGSKGDSTPSRGRGP